MADCYVSKSGNDGNNGFTSGAPKLTLAAAPGVVTTGGSVFLNKGDTWTGENITMAGGASPTQESERITFTSYGSGNQPVVSPGADTTVTVTAVSAYEADEADMTTITASGGGFVAGDVNKTLYLETNDVMAVIKTFVSSTVIRVKADFSTATITQTGTIHSLVGVSLNGRDYITIDGLRITDSIGIPMQSGTAIKIINNTVDAMRGAGGFVIEVGQTDAASLIDGNTIQQCPSCLAAIGGSGVQNMTISNNTIDDNDADGIKLPTATGVIIENNIIGDARLGALGSQGHQDGIVIGPTAINCIVRYNTVFNHTQLIYAPVKDEASASFTGNRIYGNLGYIKTGYTGGSAPFIAIDGTRATDQNTVSDNDFFSNTCGDLGGDIAPIRILGASGGTFSDNNIRNNCCWTDRTVTTKEVLTDANTEASVDVDYSVCGGFGKYTTAGNGANSVAGAANPFTDYTGKDANTFDFTITSDGACNDAGDPSLTSNVSVPATFVDIDGTTRTKNSGDIGAYENTGAAATTAGRMQLQRLRSSG